MNINAGTNQYNLSLKKMKEEKRPTFSTIFDKLDARSKKLNAKNPLNAVLTNDQMYRYYLSEVEPQLHGSADDLDLEDVIGDKSLKDMKLSEFAKLLSGDLDNTKTTPVYETLTAGVSYSPMVAPLIAPPTPIPTPVPTPTPTPPPTIATPVIPAPSSSVASALAPPVPVSGLMPTGTGSIPVAAPSGAPVSAPAVAPVVPAVAPVVPAVAAAAPTAALTISTAPAPAGLATPPFSPTTAFASLTSGVSSAVSAISSLVSSKPSPSAISVPPSAVASGATTAVASGVPTATPASGVLSPTSGAAAAGAVGVSPSAVASSLIYTDEGNYNLWFNSAATSTNSLTYNNALKAGLPVPKVPDDISSTFASNNLKWVKHIKAMNDYNEQLQKEGKDPTGEYSFTFTGKQQSLINALKANGNDAQKVYEGIIKKTIKLEDFEPSGGAKSGKGKKKK